MNSEHSERNQKTKSNSFVKLRGLKSSASGSFSPQGYQPAPIRYYLSSRYGVKLKKVPSFSKFADFNPVFKKNRRYFTENFKILVHRRIQENVDIEEKKATTDYFPRFVLIISKKVSKSSVVRNTSRRKVREIIRKNQVKIYPLLKNCDIVIYINRDLAKISKQDKEFNKVLEKEIIDIFVKESSEL